MCELFMAISPMITDTHLSSLLGHRIYLFRIFGTEHCTENCCENALHWRNKRKKLQNTVQLRVGGRKLSEEGFWNIYMGFVNLSVKFPELKAFLELIV
jgi:hypothetical protein